MNYLLFSFLKTLYFCYNSMVFLSIYNILYTIGKLWFPSFQWDCCQSEILTYFLSSQLSIQISYLSPVQLVLFKILEYSRQCKIPHSKTYALLLRTDNQESCSATLGPHLYWIKGECTEFMLSLVSHLKEDIYSFPMIYNMPYIDKKTIKI